ncbi:hypothetical protein ABZW03_36710, partial [Kitasatospora sp. NPDC004799]
MKLDLDGPDDLDDLHASPADPLLDAMTFPDEVTTRYPDAVSFAPGRPYEGFFEPEDVQASLRTHLAHPADRGPDPAAVREAAERVLPEQLSRFLP